MKNSLFFLIHGLATFAIISIILIDFVIDGKNNPEPTQIIGLLLLNAAIVLTAEISALILLSDTPKIIRRKLFSAWALFIFPLSLILIIDGNLHNTFGSHINYEIIRYTTENWSELQELIRSEISVLNISTLIVILLISLVIKGIGSRAALAAAPNKNHHALVLVPSIFILTIMVSTSSCPDPQEKRQEERVPDTIFKKLIVKKCDPQKKIVRSAFAAGISKLRQSQIERRLTSNPEETVPKIPKIPIEVQRTAQSKEKNIVIIALESFRLDAITPYNDMQKTTPFLNKLASEGYLVENAIVNQPHTSKSLVAINCGMPPHPSHSAKNETRKEGLPYKCLPDYLKPHGYRTGFFQTARRSFEKRDQLAKNMGFEHFIAKDDLNKEKWQVTNYFGYEDRAMLEPITTWLDQSTDPFLISMVTLTSHHPYTPPKRYPKKKYNGSKRWSSYLNTIRYTDEFLEELFQEFEKRELLDSTLFVIVGDHGIGVEGFSSSKLYDKNTNVPLIVWNPDLIKPRKISGLRQQTDIIPTIFDILRWDVTQGHFYGKSLHEKVDNRVSYINCKFNNCLGRITTDVRFIDSYSKGVAAFDNQKDGILKHDLISIIPEPLRRKYQEELDSWLKDLRNVYRQ